MTIHPRCVGGGGMVDTEDRDLDDSKKVTRWKKSPTAAIVTEPSSPPTVCGSNPRGMGCNDVRGAEASLLQQGGAVVDVVQLDSRTQRKRPDSESPNPGVV